MAAVTKPGHSGAGGEKRIAMQHRSSQVSAQASVTDSLF
jgi:hypothetical protein